MLKIANDASSGLENVTWAEYEGPFGPFAL